MNHLLRSLLALPVAAMYLLSGCRDERSLVAEWHDATGSRRDRLAARIAETRKDLIGESYDSLCAILGPPDLWSHSVTWDLDGGGELIAHLDPQGVVTHVCTRGTDRQTSLPFEQAAWRESPSLAMAIDLERNSALLGRSIPEVSGFLGAPSRRFGPCASYGGRLADGQRELVGPKLRAIFENGRVVSFEWGGS